MKSTARKPGKKPFQAMGTVSAKAQNRNELGRFQEQKGQCGSGVAGEWSENLGGGEGEETKS